MSVIKTCLEESLVFLSHENYLKEIYKKDGADSTKMSRLFELATPFRMDAEAEAVANRITAGAESPKKKRKKEPIREEILAEVEDLKTKLQVITSKYKDELFCGSASLAQIRENNRETRTAVQQIMNTLEEETQFAEDTNATDEFIESRGVILPPRSSYKVVDVREMSLQSKFDLVLMDPPWENKHVKRAKRNSSTGYSMLENDTIKNIPMRDLLLPGGVVVVWCSNNTRHRTAVRDWFLSWGAEEVGMWYWLKLTKFGEPVCDFSAGKNPYEVILIAKRTGQSTVSKNSSGANEKSSAANEYTSEANKNSSVSNGNFSADLNVAETEDECPKDLVIVSVPSSIHSHKPPLSATLDLFFKDRRKRLEIFGRYLQPGWTTVGLQPSKLNSAAFFK